MDIDRALDPLRLAVNLYLAWADTPGDVLTALLPVVIILGLIGWILDRRSRYWRRTSGG